MKYKCPHCGDVFEEPGYIDFYNSYDFWGGSFSHNDGIAVCPECESEEFDEYIEEDEDDTE